METGNEKNTPKISGVSAEIQQSIITDLKSAPVHKADEGASWFSDKKIGISVSPNEELGELGYSDIHLKDLMIEIARNLLINGATIVYGGTLQKEGYTALFSELAYQYRSKDDSKKICFETYFAYPVWCRLTEDDLVRFKKFRTSLYMTPAPAGTSDNYLEYLTVDTPEKKLVWAKSLSASREDMITNTHARIFAGGKLHTYAGKMPGVIEEAMIAVKLQKPLYLIGALGGATREVISAIKGYGFSYDSNANHQSELYINFKALYNREGGVIDPIADAAFFEDFGINRLSALNCLSPEENERLFVSTNLPEMLFYIFKGLQDVMKR